MDGMREAFTALRRMEKEPRNGALSALAAPSLAAEKPPYCSAGAEVSDCVPVADVSGFALLSGSRSSRHTLPAHGDAPDYLLLSDSCGRHALRAHGDVFDRISEYGHALREHGADVSVDGVSGDVLLSSSRDLHALRAHGLLLDDVSDSEYIPSLDGSLDSSIFCHGIVTNRRPLVRGEASNAELMWALGRRLNCFLTAAHVSTYIPVLSSCRAYALGFGSTTIAAGFSPLAAYSFPSVEKAWNIAQMGARSVVGCLFTGAGEVSNSNYVPVSISRNTYSLRSRHVLRAQATGSAGFSPGIDTDSWPSPLRVSSTRGSAARVRAGPHLNFAEEGNVLPDLNWDRVLKITLLCVLLQKRGHFNSPSLDSMPTPSPLKAPALVESKKDDKQKWKDTVNILLLCLSIYIGSSAAKGDKRLMFLVSLFDGSMKSYP